MRLKLHIDSPFIEGNIQGLSALKEAIECALDGDVSNDRYARMKAENEDEFEITYCVRMTNG